MKIGVSRRAFCGLLGAGLAWPMTAAPGRAQTGGFRIRTVTAGVDLEHGGDTAKVDHAIAFLNRARSRFEGAGYELQTVRVATPPVAKFLPTWGGSAGEAAIGALDRLCSENGAVLSIGPVIADDRHDPDFAPWAARLAQATEATSFTVAVASPGGGIHHRAIRSAAEATLSLAKAKPGGDGNFRFAAIAFCPPGTPFFPAAYHAGDAAFSIGLETPPLLLDAFADAKGLDDAREKLRRRMNEALGRIEKLALGLAEESGRRYLGIDTSPAPGPDASIGEALEALIGAPFGSPSTLAACATVTDVLKSLSVRTCGYSGLMLPVLEDRVLAARAAEGRYGVTELLLYSSVCGTGLDVVPLPGDTPTDTLAAIITDVAALATKYQKPLSARLFPVAGKAAGDMVRFDSPWLMDSRVLGLP